MTLLEFKKHIEQFPDGTVFNTSISEPFSWRGVYAEVAFSVENTSSTKEETIERINMAYDNEFIGYKGGEYRYGDYTDVHFEDGISSYTDGSYCAAKIAELECDKIYQSQEARLVNLMFNKP